MELSAPIRIYWDFPPTAGAPSPREIVAEILAARVLALDLNSEGETLPDELWEVLEGCGRRGVAVTLTASPGALSAPVLVELARFKLDAVLLSICHLADLEALLPAYRAAGGALPGVSFRVTDESYREIPALLDLCRESGIGRLVFPIQRAEAGAPVFRLTPDRQHELARAFAGRELPEGLRLSVHDPFLWKTIYPERPFPEGVCQAANSMLYIACDAAVYPCPIMPYRLGTLGKETLVGIVSSPKKRELRKLLIAPPADCLSCTRLDHCRGGCRGRGYLSGDDWNAADPSCGVSCAGCKGEPI